MTSKLKLKYKVRRLKSGEWAVWANKRQYFSDMTFKTEEDAVYASLSREGGELVDKLDELQTRLEATGRISPTDPYGWRS